MPVRPNRPSLNSLGKLCSSSRSRGVDRVRVKRKSSVKRMSIIEDGHVAEVLYLIPKQYMDQIPYLNPQDYYLSERLNEVASGSARSLSRSLFLCACLSLSDSPPLSPSPSLCVSVSVALSVQYISLRQSLYFSDSLTSSLSICPSINYLSI